MCHSFPITNIKNIFKVLSSKCVVCSVARCRLQGTGICLSFRYVVWICMTLHHGTRTSYRGGATGTKKESIIALLFSARNRGRTCTALRPLVPETSASTNSAIRALEVSGCKYNQIRQIPHPFFHFLQLLQHFEIIILVIKEKCSTFAVPKHSSIAQLVRAPDC